MKTTHTKAPRRAQRKTRKWATRGPFAGLLMLAVGSVGALAMVTIQLMAENKALAQTAFDDAAALAAAFNLRVATDPPIPKKQAPPGKGDAVTPTVAVEPKRGGIAINPGASTATLP